jgi:hypothetical protein
MLKNTKPKVAKKLTLGAIVSKSKQDNRKRNETFDSSATAYLRAKPSIKLNKKLGEGMFGAFFSIEGNDKLGVKVPKCTLDEYAADGLAEATLARKQQTCKECWRKTDIKKEAKNCHKNKYNEQEMLTATRTVPVNRHGMKCVGLVRPLIGEVTNSNAKRLTNDQLEMIRLKLIELTEQNISLDDGLQIGFTGSGRVLQFDLGHVLKSTRTHAFTMNSEAWKRLLEKAGKFGNCPSLDKLESNMRMAEMFDDEVAMRECDNWLDHIENVLNTYGRIMR